VRILKGINKMINIGITGNKGFIGSHLVGNFKLRKTEINIINFEDEYFQNEDALEKFILDSDVIIHLAALNRHNDADEIYSTNIELVKLLINRTEKLNKYPHIIFASSTQESKDNIYGKSKSNGRKLFIEWKARNKSKFTGMIIPNVFGPFGIPFFNSVISTFSFQLTHDEKPKIQVDNTLELIYIQNLCTIIYKIIKEEIIEDSYVVPYDFKVSVKEILSKLNGYKKHYIDENIVPCLSNPNDVNLFNTFRSYIECSFFPRLLAKNADDRGYLIEIIKENSGGQSFYSITKPGITRGNHFHTRKVERFCVVKGEALIKLRKIGEEKIIQYYVNGYEPSIIDMPVWFTHNITNIGKQEMHTLFWTNEIFNKNDSDTFFESV
jgi:UDP-2-acetamido-2,6-beta-L-arabino-hexul-4-ose reductase